MEKIELIEYNGYYKINLPDEKYRGKGAFYETYIKAPYFDKETSKYKEGEYSIHFISPYLIEDDRKGMAHKMITFFDESKPPISDPFTYEVIFPGEGQKKTEYLCSFTDLNMLEYELLTIAIVKFNREMMNRIEPYTVKVIAEEPLELTGEYAELARIFETVPYDKWQEYTGPEDFAEFIDYIEEKTGFMFCDEESDVMILRSVLSKDGKKKLISSNQIDFKF